MKLKKILCPVDFSAGSQRALRMAVQLATETDAELVIVHALYIPPTVFAGETTYPATMIQQLDDDADQMLQTTVGTAKLLGAQRVSATRVTGLPWKSIIEVAEDSTYDLIVIGTHGRTGLSRVLLGSVAEKVIRHAPCSVLAVRHEGEEHAFRHILCPVDFTPASKHAIDLASSMVRPGGAGLTLLHVLEVPGSYAGELNPEMYRDLDNRTVALLEQWVNEYKTKLSVPVTGRTRVGWAGKEILGALDDDRTFDLVVMGSHGYSGIKRAILGSVAEKVVRHAACPVLIARQPE